MQRYLSGGLSYEEVAAEFDVNVSTLSNWMSQTRSMPQKKDKGRSAPARTDEGRTPQEKLELLLRSAALAEEELGEFLRAHGLRDGDLERWQREALSGLGDEVLPPAAQARLKRAERQVVKTQARLREAEALLDLQKKVQALWVDRAADDECDESSE